MPVRIVLRGLILMTVKPDKDHPERGTITARLIDGSRSLDEAVHASFKKYEGRKKPHPDFENCMRMHQGHHKHQGEIQVFDGDKQRDGAGLIALREGEDIDIRIDSENTNFVATADNYDKFMPKLRKIAQNAGLPPSLAIQGDSIAENEFNSDFISHTVTINRGVVRVRAIGDWDAGSITIPEKFRSNNQSVPERFRLDGEDAVFQPDGVYQPAKVRFLNANVLGYVATECVVDVPDTKTVTIGPGSQLQGTYTGHSMASGRAAEETVEILITNYAPQQTIPLPWTFHYRWMYEAAGYATPINLGGGELHDLGAFGTLYDNETWLCETEMFLGSDGETGYPFPYRLPDMWRVPLGDLNYGSRPEAPTLVPADPWDPIACPMADLSPGK